MFQREDGQVTQEITPDYEGLNEMAFFSYVYNRYLSLRNDPKGYMNSGIGLIAVEPGGIHQ